MKKLSLLLIALLASLTSWAVVVPNILATDLRCVPHEYENKYTFSFNTNHKPTKAYIRFYMSYSDMQKSLNVVNADNYNGTNTNMPAFYYEFPSAALKQGQMTVILEGVGGKTDANGKITNGCLPAGVIYWSVYVEAEKGTEWGMIYKQGNSGEDAHYRLHATVNNYPETDGFGHIYAAQYNASAGKKSMMVYAPNPNGTASNRYKLVKEYLNATGTKPKFENQRRPTVAPDGKVYIADHGATNFNANSDRPMMFNNGGIYVWNPNTQTGNELQLQQFLKEKTETSSGVAIWNHGGTLKLYGMNTYGEFEFHSLNGKLWKGNIYSPANQANIDIYGWNGFKEYNLGTPDNSLLTETSGTEQRALGMGDAGGNTSIVAMDKGIWICQHRDNDVQYTIDQWTKDKRVHALPDNIENYLLSFVPYGSNTRTWRSCTTNGINYSEPYGSSEDRRYNKYDLANASDLTQNTNSPVQSAPGAGMAYRRINGVDYIFMVQHTGDIAQLKVTWSGNTPSVTHYKTYTSVGTKTTVPNSSRKTGTITTMCFDYAGNLVTTAGATYFGHQQDIIVYALPYNRTNAREIQAPNSCRMIPERLSQDKMEQGDIENVIQPYITGGKTCPLDFFRPLQEGSFNSICLPFSIANLAGTPYAGAEVMKFDEARLEEVGGEQHLYFDFVKVTTAPAIEAGVPYLIQPNGDVRGIVRFNTVQFEKTQGNTVNTGDYADFIGTFAHVNMDEPTAYPRFMVVSENRLAEIDGGTLRGFRSYFQMKKDITNTISLLNFKKPTATGTEMVVDGKKVNVEKLLLEGRAYIRVGETLYTITGEVVGR